MAKIRNIDTNNEKILKAEGQTLAFGIFSCVDGGKTTLSKSILHKVAKDDISYGTISLDTGLMERKRGITIFSKEVNFNYKGKAFVLVDTPGHKDFIWEINRVLPVLDIAILIIPCDTDVNNRTRYLINLLKENRIPTLIFFNKVDMLEDGFETYFYDLKKKNQIDEKIFIYKKRISDTVMDEIALLSEDLMDKYIEKGTLCTDDIVSDFLKCTLYPSFSGSALTGEGVGDVLDFIYKINSVYPCDKESLNDSLSAYVYKISRDFDGKKLCHLRILKGQLRIKESLAEGKINEIRKYKNDTYDTTVYADTKDIVAISGLKDVYPGKLIGSSPNRTFKNPILPDTQCKPGLIYKIKLENTSLSYEEIRNRIMSISDEFPELFIEEDKENKCLYCRLYGPLQGDMLIALLWERFNVNISFAPLALQAYERVLKDYIEPVYLCLPQSIPYLNLKVIPSDTRNITVEVNIRNEQLNSERSVKIKQWLMEQIWNSQFKNSAEYLKYGYMTIEITSGRGSLNNVDNNLIFRQIEEALYRIFLKADMAVKAPTYKYTFVTHDDDYNKIYPILKKRHLTPEIEQKEKGKIKVCGEIYYEEGYNFIEEINKANISIDEISMFYSGYTNFTDYGDYREKRSLFKEEIEKDFKNIWEHPASEDFNSIKKINNMVKDVYVEQESILKSIYRKGSKNKRIHKDKKIITAEPSNRNLKKYNLPKHMFIDGYNVIFHIDSLSQVAKSDIGASRDMLIEWLKEYAVYMSEPVTVVFDGYKKADNPGSYYKENFLEIVYTKTGVTADRYIESSVYKLIDKEDITVVTSDRMEQMNVFSQGAKRMSVNDFKEYMNMIKTEIQWKIDVN